MHARRPREDLLSDRDETVRRAFGFCGVDPGFRSDQFEREWETGSGKSSGGFRLMDRAVRLPGLRALDRNFDRLPESMRWMVEKVVHSPDKPPAPKPEIPDDLMATLKGRFRDDVAGLEAFAGRSFEGWNDYSS